MRGRILAGALCAAPLAAQLPSPPAGEYVCTQSTLAVAGVSTTGLPAATAVASQPGAFGNLIVERGGSYVMTRDRGKRGSFRFEPSNGRVIFSGALGGLGNTYGTRGRNVYFDFTSRSIGFSCALQTATDYGQQAGTRTGQDGAAVVVSRTALPGTLFYSTRDGIAKLNLTDGAQSRVSPAFQFDVRGNDMVVITAQGGLAIASTEGTGTRPIPVYGNSNQSPRFSPDGQRIALLGMQASTSVEDALLAANSSATVQPLVIGRDGRVQVAFGSAYSQPTFAPDGRVVLAGAKALGSLAGNAQTGIFITVGRGPNVRRLDANLDAPHSPAVSPDGALVAFVNGTRILVMPLAGGAARPLYQGSSRFLGALAWSPDGSLLAFADNQVLKTVTRDGRVVPVQDRGGFGVQTTGTVVWR